MSNIVVSGSTVPSKWSDDVAKAMGSTAYLPRLQLYGGNSEAVKEGKVPMGAYGLATSRNVKPLGKPLDVLVIEWRPKAMFVSKDKSVVECVYDPDAPRFKEISAMADTTSDSGCMFGPEFLVWVPNEDYATYFLSSKSARYEFNNLKKLINCMASLDSVLVKGTGKQTGRSWHAPKVSDCLTPYQLPAIEEIDKQKSDFLNPKEFTPEEATPDVAARG